MKILIFTEGCVIMHLIGKDVSRKERVKQSQAGGAQKGFPYDFTNYIPIDNAVGKLSQWQEQGAKICYLTSRKTNKEVEIIKNILKKFNFPKGKLYFRNQNEIYAQVVEKVMPEVFIEDDCESIGGDKAMISTYLSFQIKNKIKVIKVKEFEGIDLLPNNFKELIS